MADSKKENSGSVLDTLLPIVGELLSPSSSSKKTTGSTSKKTTAKKTSSEKKTSSKTASKKTAAKKTTAKKTAATSKTAAGSSPSKTIFTVTVGKKKFSYDDIVKKVTSSYGGKITKLEITVKTDEGKAYYEVNDSELGSVDIW